MFWANSLWWPLLYLGVVFWTVGEGALVPIPDMLVHEIAVDGRKGLYFGLSDARQFGFFAGPVVGGLLLAGSTAAYFAVMGAAIFACVPFLLRAARSISAEAAPTASASVETVAAEAA